MQDGQVKKIAEHDLQKKVQRLALDSNLHHGPVKGDKANFSSDNQYYIERNSSASQGLPLSMMSFNNFGGDQMDDSDASISYII